MRAATLWTDFQDQRTPPLVGQERTRPLCKGKCAEEAKEAAQQVDYAERLVRYIGPVNVFAVRALDAGVDPRDVWLRWQEALLTPLLASVLALARKQGVVTNEDLREQDQSLSPSTISNRLAELERRGLLIRAKPQIIRGGGRRFAYRAWDQEPADEA